MARRGRGLHRSKEELRDRGLAVRSEQSATVAAGMQRLRQQRCACAMSWAFACERAAIPFPTLQAPEARRGGPHRRRFLGSWVRVNARAKRRGRGTPLVLSGGSTVLRPLIKTTAGDRQRTDIGEMFESATAYKRVRRATPAAEHLGRLQRGYGGRASRRRVDVGDTRVQRATMMFYGAKSFSRTLNVEYIVSSGALGLQPHSALGAEPRLVYGCFAPWRRHSSVLRRLGVKAWRSENQHLGCGGLSAFGFRELTSTGAFMHTGSNRAFTGQPIQSPRPSPRSLQHGPDGDHGPV